MGISVGYDGIIIEKNPLLISRWEMDENGPFIDHFDDLPIKNGDSL